MIDLIAEDRWNLYRWLLSGAIVLIAHGGIAAGMAQWRDPEPDEPSSAIVIDLAPMPVAPTNVPMDIPPGPEQIQTDATPERPVEQVEEKVEPEVAPAPEPDVAVAALPPEIEPQPPTPADPPAPVTTAPPTPKLQEAPVAAAPAQGQLNISNSTAIPAWKRQIVGLLERNKRYPSAAQARRQQGTAQLSFSLDRQGRVTSSRIVQSSGSPALDQETLALVQRAQPFPPPPPGLPGAQVNLTVPIRFNIR